MRFVASAVSVSVDSLFASVGFGLSALLPDYPGATPL